MTGPALEALLRRLGAREHVPLAPRTTWRVGGPARFLVSAGSARGAGDGGVLVSVEAIAELCGRCHEAVVTLCVLGRGSNVWIPDAGIDGVVLTFPDAGAPLAVETGERTASGLQPSSDRTTPPGGDRTAPPGGDRTAPPGGDRTAPPACRPAGDQEGALVIAGAGVSMARLSAATAVVGTDGFTWCAGIPGSVGGSVVGNAGLVTGGRREMADLVETLTVVEPTGHVRRMSAADLGFGPRHSRLLDTGGVVVEVTLRGQGRAEPAALSACTRALVAERRARQPRGATAGSTFVAPTEVGATAGELLDRAGLKGHRIGGAQVTHRHANWIENLGNATAADIAALMAHMVDTVERQFGVTLRPEVRRLP